MNVKRWDVGRDQLEYERVKPEISLVKATIATELEVGISDEEMSSKAIASEFLKLPAHV